MCIFYAVTHDFLKDVQVQDVAEYEDGLYARMAAQHNDVLDAIRTTGQLERGDRGRAQGRPDRFIPAIS